jgi:hypothetical protein
MKVKQTASNIIAGIASHRSSPADPSVFEFIGSNNFAYSLIDQNQLF